MSKHSKFINLLVKIGTILIFGLACFLVISLIGFGFFVVDEVQKHGIKGLFNTLWNGVRGESYGF